MNFLRGDKYPIDKQGTSPDNRIASETHQVSPTYNVIVPVHAPFFAESMVVRLGDRTLVKEVDYQFDDLDPDATEASNKSVYNTIVLKRNDIQGEVILDYQTYGMSNFVGVIAKYIDMFLKDNRGIDFKNLFNVPERFKPIYHLHHVKDIIGIWPIVNELQKVVKAIENLRYKGNLKLRGEILDHIASLNQKFDNYRAIVSDALDLRELKATIRDIITDLVTEEIRKAVNGTTGNVWKVVATLPSTTTTGQANNILINQLDYASFFSLTESQEQRLSLTGHYLGTTTNNVPLFGIFFKDSVIVTAISSLGRLPTVKLKVVINKLDGAFAMEVQYFKDGVLKRPQGQTLISLREGSLEATTPRVANAVVAGIATNLYQDVRNKANSMY